MKTKVDLGPVQTTLLIPLLDRALEAQKKRPLLRDEKAVEIIAALDYDFEKWKKLNSGRGAACVRTRIFDDLVREFLEQHPCGTVVEIGAGLNTRYERLDNGRARWLEIDLPDSMQLRRRFFEDTQRRKMVAASVTDQDWYEELRELPEPYCFVSEAVMIYLDNSVVQGVVEDLAQAFPSSWLLTDTTSTKTVDGQHKHELMRTLSKESWFRWRCEDPREVQAWGAKLERSMTFVDAPASIRARFPLKWRVLTKIMPWLVRAMVDGYRINRYTLLAK